MYSLRQRFSASVSTLGAILRGIRVDGDQDPTSFFRFVGQALPELRPSGILNRFSEAVIVYHAVEGEVFDGDQPKMVDQPTSQRMGELKAI